MGKSKNPDERIKLKVGFGKKAEEFDGNIYSKEFWKKLRIIIQRHYGTELPAEFKKLTEPIGADENEK